MSKIVVMGSVNMDIVMKVQNHPYEGETISSLETQSGPGGKGANQAVAVSRSGTSVILMGAVGKDSFGAELLTMLEQANLSTEHIIQKDGLTGLAFIDVDRYGKNQIILSSGANGKIDMKTDFSLEALDTAKALILQNEIPWEFTQFMIQEAHKRNVKVIVNPAPIEDFSVEILPKIDILVLNEHEAEKITGLKVRNEKDAKNAANYILFQLGGNAVVVTLGEKGVIYADLNSPALHRKAFNVNVLDTTAAGDTFIGYFTSCILSNKSIQESLDFASAAAALTVTREGAITSIPTLNEVNDFIRNSRRNCR
ncbi:ribokinase [Bacillus cihuensis]|uniref:ribokinase n=1 Tax=Bacillus cihuensis TaxID=1208599 RepID=UPI000410E1AE|nr:ribokinase [Bacillus cihuensis]